MQSTNKNIYQSFLKFIEFIYFFIPIHKFYEECLFNHKDIEVSFTEETILLTFKSKN